MTQETFTIAAIGGFAALVSLIVLVAVSFAVYVAVARAIDTHEAYRERRRTLRTCRAIDALGTTNEPKE